MERLNSKQKRQKRSIKRDPNTERPEEGKNALFFFKYGDSEWAEIGILEREMVFYSHSDSTEYKFCIWWCYVEDIK